MKKSIQFILCFVLCFACSEKKQVSQCSAKKENYEEIMKQKSFTFARHGECDNTIKDTIYKKGVNYIDLKVINDTSVFVYFKFRTICCQDFGGDYTIKNDTLTFTYEPVNNEVCACECVYHYKLVINQLKTKIKELIIREKYAL